MCQQICYISINTYKLSTDLFLKYTRIVITLLCFSSSRRQLLETTGIMYRLPYIIRKGYEGVE